MKTAAEGRHLQRSGGATLRNESALENAPTHPDPRDHLNTRSCSRPTHHPWTGSDGSGRPQEGSGSNPHESANTERHESRDQLLLRGSARIPLSCAVPQGVSLMVSLRPSRPITPSDPGGGGPSVSYTPVLDGPGGSAHPTGALVAQGRAAAQRRRDPCRASRTARSSIGQGRYCPTPFDLVDRQRSQTALSRRET